MGKRIKNLLSVVLALILLVTTCVMISGCAPEEDPLSGESSAADGSSAADEEAKNAESSVPAQEFTTIEYEFTGDDADRAGYAEGTITVTPGANSRTSGCYSLFWANDEEILADYRAIAALTITGRAAKCEMDYKLAIPEGATKVVVFETKTSKVEDTSLSQAAAVYNIPESKRFSDTKRYSYALTSDVHIGCASNYTTVSENYYNSVVFPAGFTNTAEYNWSLAMKYYAQTDAKFMISAGDMTDRASQTEYDTFLGIFEDSGFEGEIYTVNGNHEDVATFVSMTGNPGLYYEFTQDGDHFLMLGMSDNKANTDAVLTTAELDWLEGKLKEYSGDGHNIFIVMHPHIANYTPGDRVPATHGSPMNMNGANVARLVKLLEAYPQTVYMNGHTHLILEVGLNYSDRDGTTARMFHIPSTGAAKTRATNLSSADGVNQSYVQGYLVAVYEDNLVYLGVDLTTGKAIPTATYIIPTVLPDAG